MRTEKPHVISHTKGAFQLKQPDRALRRYGTDMGVGTTTADACTGTNTAFAARTGVAGRSGITTRQEF